MIKVLANKHPTKNEMLNKCLHAPFGHWGLVKNHVFDVAAFATVIFGTFMLGIIVGDLQEEISRASMFTAWGSLLITTGLLLYVVWNEWRRGPLFVLIVSVMLLGNVARVYGLFNHGTSGVLMDLGSGLLALCLYWIVHKDRINESARKASRASGNYKDVHGGRGNADSHQLHK